MADLKLKKYWRLKELSFSLLKIKSDVILFHLFFYFLFFILFTVSLNLLFQWVSIIFF